MNSPDRPHMNVNNVDAANMTMQSINDRDPKHKSLYGGFNLGQNSIDSVGDTNATL
jgi:hypothetical protein